MRESMGMACRRPLRPEPRQAFPAQVEGSESPPLKIEVTAEPRLDIEQGAPTRMLDRLEPECPIFPGLHALADWT